MGFVLVRELQQRFLNVKIYSGVSQIDEIGVTSI
jgi:hypothetical protein